MRWPFKTPEPSGPPTYRIFLVRHSIGTFIGVAQNLEAARKHWGDDAIIEPFTEGDAADFDERRPLRVFLAI